MLKLTEIKHNYLINFLLNFAILFSFNQVLAHLPKIGEWETAVTKFEISNSDIKDLKLNNTILGVLVKESGKEIDDYLEDDKKTLRFFKITYRVPIKLKKDVYVKEEDIIQYGLFKALPKEMQEKLDDSATQNITVQYKVHDPLFVVFVVKDKTFSAPALLTDKISLFENPNLAD